MTFDPDDPRLTAFALGELEGDEREAVASLISENDEARQFVDETRRLAGLLSETLRSELASGLDPARRDAIAAHLDGPPEPVPARRIPWLPIGLAAAVVLGGGALAFYLSRSGRDGVAPLLVLKDSAREPQVTVTEGGNLEVGAKSNSSGAPGVTSYNGGAAVIDGSSTHEAPSPHYKESRSIVGASTIHNYLQAGSEPAGVAVAESSTPRPSMPAPADDYDAVGAENQFLSLQATSSQSGQSGDSATPEPLPNPSMSGTNSRQPSAGKPASGFVNNLTDLKPGSANQYFGPKLKGAVTPGEGFAQLTPNRRNLRGPAEPSGGPQTPSSRAMDQPNTALPPIEEDRRGGLRAKTITKLETAKPGTTDHTIDSNSMQDFVERQRTEAPPASPPAGPASNQGQPDAGSAVVGLVQRGSVERDQNNEPLSAERRQELFRRGAVEATPPAPGAQPSKNEQKQKKPQSASAPNSALALAAPSGAGQYRNLGALPGLNQPQQPVVQNQIRQAIQPPNTEEYAPLIENDFEPVSAANTLSTFSIDVDTASYANVRRFLNQSLLPPPDAVRIEEMVNYFSYHYPSPDGGVPFSVNTEVTRCPWEPDHQIVRIGLKGEEVRFEDRRPTNLVFVVDVSGSMTPANKLPLVKVGLRMLAEQLTENDRISIVVYAGQAGMALPSTTGDHKQTIVRAIDALQAGGSTNGAGGIEMAYDEAVQHFLKGGVNRVILATDGDFNVGTSDAGSLARIAEEKAKTGVFLSVLGVGEGNLNDHLMESIADKGNGNYSYLDNLDEARKVLVEQVGGTLVTIAKDVKIQVDFNPATVGAYRLIGYENRKLANRDFRDDTKDAGEIGSGHTVTALYEIIPPGEEADKLAKTPEPSKYVKPAKVDENTKDLLTVRLRYKAPDGQTSKEIQHPVSAEPVDLGRASSDTKFAASVAEFGLLLRNSKYKGQASFDAVLELARANLGDDASGRRHEFVELVEKARTLPPR